MQIKPWDEQRQQVLIDRYALTDAKGNKLESSKEQIWERVAAGVANGKQEQELFESLLSDFKFVPGGRVLCGVGSGTMTTLFNCFFVPFEGTNSAGADSRKSLLQTIANIVEINCRGGGVGVNWSTIRPKGAHVKGVNGKSSGVVSWGHGLNAMAAQVEQGGSREAALIYLLEDWHPDILDFINMKNNDLSTIQQANISVAVSDEFMYAVQNDLLWDLRFPDTACKEYDKQWNGDIYEWGYRQKLPIKTYQTIRARELWEKICESAWKTGEPGLVFLDRCNEMSNTAMFEKVKGINVCGEQPLPDWGVCNLGSINLVAHLLPDGTVNYVLLEQTINAAVRFLDNVIDKSTYFNSKMKDGEERSRRIGLGTMGLADALLVNKIPYGNNPECLNWIENIYDFIKNTAYEASAELARERGVPDGFDTQDPERFLSRPFIKTLPQKTKSKINEFGIRNICILTQAPTGTTSILAGVSSGIEPIFSWTYNRKDNTGEYTVKHPLYETVEGKDLPGHFVTAHDLTPKDHIAVQATIQKYVDSSISKTINVPKNHTVEEVSSLFKLAYQNKCKGIAYYRDGSREGVLRRTDDKEIATGGPEPCPRPTRLQGETVQWATPLGKIYVVLNKNQEGKPFEVFCQMSKSGSDLLAFTEAIGRLISLCLRSGVDIKHVIYHLSGIGGNQSTGFGPDRVRSVPDAISQALAHLFTTEQANGDYSGRLCTKCGTGSVVYEEGCYKCNSCGDSKC